MTHLLGESRAGDEVAVTGAAQLQLQRLKLQMLGD